jgi:hypothetical protein
MTMTANLTIHRLLDDAFADIPVTAATRDLKEELRGNLLARVDELEAAGVDPDTAARRAITELGDIADLLDEDTPAGADDGGDRAWAEWEALSRSHRVRPNPWFVIRVVIYVAAILIGILWITLHFAAAIPRDAWYLLTCAAGSTVFIGVLVADALAQETTTNHPMPAGRARAYGFATALAVAGLSLLGFILAGTVGPPWSFGVFALVPAAAIYAYLGVTQTNRRKAWVRQAVAEMPTDHFSKDPAAAARFGMYTGVIWIVGIAAVPALGFTVGWWWIALPLVGALVATLLLLARMLFRPEQRP